MDTLRYTGAAISLHWLLALLIFAGWGLGIYMADLPDEPTTRQYFSWHKSIGVTVFLLAILRVGWLATHSPPPMPTQTPAWQTRIARFTHAALYILMFALPLTGWLMSSAKGAPTWYLGLWPLPDLVGKDKALGDTLGSIHELLAFTLAALVLLHIAAALKHQFVDRDNLVGRMSPLRPRHRQGRDG